MKPAGIHRNAERVLVIDLPLSGVLTSFELESVSVAFFDGKRAEYSDPVSRVFNQIAYYIAPGFTHTELAFRFISPDKKHESWIACCIYRGESIHFEAKTGKYFFDSMTSLWTLVKLEVKKEVMEQLLIDCVLDVDMGISFTKTLYWNFLNPFKSCQCTPGLRQSTWCTEHAAQRLQKLKILDLPPPASLTPQDLYNKLIQAGFFHYNKLLF
jgi:hypothetical protein